jgi:hypothetical protein
VVRDRSCLNLTQSNTRDIQDHERAGRAQINNKPPCGSTACPKATVATVVRINFALGISVSTIANGNGRFSALPPSTCGLPQLVKVSDGREGRRIG